LGVEPPAREIVKTPRSFTAAKADSMIPFGGAAGDGGGVG